MLTRKSLARTKQYVCMRLELIIANPESTPEQRDQARPELEVAQFEKEPAAELPVAGVGNNSGCGVSRPKRKRK